MAGSPKTSPESPEGASIVRVPPTADQQEKFTPERVRLILERIELGCWDWVAARETGASDRTFRWWKRQGRLAAKKLHAGESLSERETALAKFWSDLGEAEARSENVDLVMTGVIARGQFPGDAAAAQAAMKAIAWRREKKDPGRFGPVHRLEHSGPGGQPIETRSTVHDDLLGKIARIADALEAGEG